jgi:hypothetical protein
MTDTERIKLLHDSARAAIAKLTHELDIMLDAAEKYPDTFDGTFWGDNEDYCNAAVDQLQFCCAALGGAGLDIIDEIIPMTDDELNDKNPNGAAGFIYGYADHDTPISDLLAANK